MAKEKEEKPKVVIEIYKDGKPTGEYKEVSFSKKKSKEFIKNLEKQPDTTAD